MIEFRCQHCGKLLHLKDTYAGRDGWCRVCKRMVIVPDGGPPIRVEDLPPREGYARMQRLLQYAAGKADQGKAMQARLTQYEQRLTELENTLSQARQSHDDQRTRFSGLQSEHELLLASHAHAEQRIAELESALASAGQAPAASDDEEAREAAYVALQEVNRGLEERAKSQDREIAALRSALADMEAAEQAAQAGVAQHAADLEALKRHHADLESERDRLVHNLEEVASQGSGDTHLLLEQEKEISSLQAALTQLKTEGERETRASRDQIALLEARLANASQAEGRAVALQVQLDALEQARLEEAIHLEQARHAEEVSKRKLTAVEEALRHSSEANAGLEVQVEHLRCELSGRDEHIRQLGGDLSALVAKETTASLELERAVRALSSAEQRASAAASEVEAIRQSQHALASEKAKSDQAVAALEAERKEFRQVQATAADQAAQLAAQTRQISELEAEVSRLQRTLKETEAMYSARGESAGVEFQALQAEVAALRGEQARLSGERNSLNEYVAELQAEIMNLSQSLEAAAHQSSDAGRAAEVERLLAASESRVKTLEAELGRQRESLARALEEEGALAQRVGALRAENEALRSGAGPVGETAAGGSPDEFFDEDGGEEPEVIILEAHEASERSGPSAAPVEASSGGGKRLSEQQRHRERQQMMDALSDFLNK